MFAGKNEKTVMGLALTAAGYEPPDQRLRRLIREAIERTNDHTGQIVSQVMGAVRHNLELVWTLNKDNHVPALHVLIRNERSAIEIEKAREKQQAAQTVPAKDNRNTGGQSKHETQHAGAPRSAGVGSAPASATPTPKQDNANTGGQDLSDTQETTAARSSGPGSIQARAPIPPKPTPADRLKARLEAIQIVCRLDTFLVNGKPVGDCTVGEIREWAKARQGVAREAARDTRFALMLSANLPSDAKPRDHWKDNGEVEKLYQKAEAEYRGWL